MRPFFAIIAVIFCLHQAGLAQSLQHILPPSDIIDISKAFSRLTSAEKEIPRDAHVLLHRALYERNAIPSPSAEAMAELVAGSSVSTAASAEESWNTTTEAACLKAFEITKSIAASPCGMTACYNIKYLNTTTGTFQTDLRLYRTSPATGQWASADSKSFSIGIKSNGATMAAGNMKMDKRDDGLLPGPPVLRHDTARTHSKRIAERPQLLQQTSFYGQVNQDLTATMSDKTKVRSYLAPNITVSGRANDGTTITADLSTDRTSFITGILADETALPATSESSPAPISASPAATSAPAKATKFVLPGKTLGIFPVGLIITGVWALLFLGTVGLGTVDRIRFREAYRRRMKREMGKDIARI